jgi:heme-degrading monooxygenase HmoA
VGGEPVTATHSTAVTRFILALNVESGSETRFVEVWSELAEAASHHPANIEQWLTRGEKDLWYVTSDWLDPAAYFTFSGSAEHDALAAAMRAISSGVGLTRSEHVRHVLSPTTLSALRPTQPTSARIGNQT